MHARRLRRLCHMADVVSVESVLMLLAALLTPLGALAATVSAMYKKRISELEAELQRVQLREAVREG